MFHWYFLLLFVALVSTNPVNEPRIINADFEQGIPTCGYDSCPSIRPGYLNVHLVAHSHDDVGWLKTVEQYYYGSKSSMQKAGVQYILDSVIYELSKDPKKKFIYVETAFFWKWWKEQHDTTKSKVRRLVKNGQLEFIGGAWSMNDEATTHYQSIIDQFTWGLRKLNETFGECGRPKIGWQIDPFGHSREMASIFAQLGFDGMLFGRLDFQDKIQRLNTKTAEMVWQGSASIDSELFTSVLFNNYAPPPGFCFDVLCDDDPIVDNKRSAEYNLDQKIADFINYVQLQAKHYVTNNIILTMGEDFTYQDAAMWYKNLDKLIKYTNAANESKVNVFYSTPSCYLKAVFEDNTDRKWPVKTDDFFPYGSDPHSYWTGYYTSRPTIKRFERLGNNFLQVCKQLYSLTDLGPEDWVDLNMMREAMGVMQHHDAVSGTEKQHVANDYVRMLTKGFEECDIITATALNKLMVKKTGISVLPKVTLESCLLLNISQCEMTEKSTDFVVTIYNPLSRPVSHYVRLPVTGKAYTVTDPDGNDQTVQLNPIADSVLRIPGRNSPATVELIFHASDLPPLGYKSYYVKQSAANDITLQQDRTGPKIIGTGQLQALFDEETSLLSHIKVNGTDFPFAHNFFWYKANVGDNAEFKNRSSGAYIFRPDGTQAKPIALNVSCKIYRGPLFEEVQLYFNNWTSTILRIYLQEKYIEVEWLIGPIPISDNEGKEVISRFTTKLNSNGQFYTDSNGREVLKRVRNFRSTWKLDLQEPVSGNYYPVTSKIAIRDEKQDVEIAVLTDRAQGGSSLEDGQLELMIHRRLLHDDAFGVGEALNETAYGAGLVVRGQHYVVSGSYNAPGSSIQAEEKDIAQRKLLAAWTFISPTSELSYQQYKSKYNMEYSGLKQSLPKNVQILTLEPWKGMSFLIRIEHVFEKNEDPILSKPVTVNLKNIFSPFTINSLQETTLGANQWLADNKRFDWKTGMNLEVLMKKRKYVHKNNKSSVEQESILTYAQWKKHYLEILREKEGEIIETEDVNDSLTELSQFDVILNPMQIRTFVVHIDKPFL